MANEIIKKDEQNIELSVIEQVVMQGDLSKLNPEQRVIYYRKVCESLGLNPYTRPFDYISLNGKLTLYAKKDATEQLRRSQGISIEKIESKIDGDLYIVTVSARCKDGRTDASTGVVTIGHLKGDAKANALMKAETKAKRRVTLSISGLGWVDETEIETIPGAKTIEVDLSTGEIADIPAQAKSKPAIDNSLSPMKLVEPEVEPTPPPPEDPAKKEALLKEIENIKFGFSKEEAERFAKGLDKNFIVIDTASIAQLEYALNGAKSIKGIK